MTKFKLAEQVRLILGGKPTYQELMLAVNQAFGQVVMSNWWSNKTQGENDINGNFIYAFDDNDIELDSKKNLYYSTLPSTFLGNIPHEMGIPHVSWMESYNKTFIRLTNGQPVLFQGLQSSNFDSNDTFFVENNRIYLPTVTDAVSDKKLLIKLVVALDGIDEQAEISIPPDIQAQIINIAVQMYSQKQNNTIVQAVPVEQGQKP